MSFSLENQILSQKEKKRISKLIVGNTFAPDISKGLYIGPSLDLVTENEEDKFIPKPRFIPWSDTAGHVAVYGTTRVGKTRLMVSFIDQAIARNMDMFIVEPKGSVGGKDKDGNIMEAGQETLGWILEFAEKHGRLRHVKYISPVFHEHSLCINPLYAMKDEEIASLISQITPATDEFFKKLGYQIAISICIGLRFLEKAEGEEVVKQAIQQEYLKVYGVPSSAIVDEDEAIYSPDLATRVVERPLFTKDPFGQEVPFRTLMTFADIERYMSQEGISALLDMVSKVTPSQFNVKTEKEKHELMELQQSAIAILSKMAKKDATYYSKVSTSFETLFSQLAKGDIGYIFCSVKINPLFDAIMNPNDGLIAVIQPYPLTYKDAANTFVRVFFSMLTSFAGNVGASGRSTPREIAMFVDEGGAVLYPGVEDLFNKGGGLGLRIFIFTQSFSDYKAGLGEEIAEIVNDNTNIKIYMRMNDLESRKKVAESFGKYKAKDPSYMGSKLDMRIQTREEEKDILLPAHIGDMQKQEFLLQYGDGRFYCMAPYQPDPKVYVKMPKVQMEKVFVDIGQEIRDSIFSLET